MESLFDLDDFEDCGSTPQDGKKEDLKCINSYQNSEEPKLEGVIPEPRTQEPPKISKTYLMLNQ